MRTPIQMAVLVLLLLTAALHAAEPAKTVTVPMFIEHDAWTLRCEDDPAIAGTQGFGMGYASLNRALAVGHRYRVSGTMGWSFLLTVDASGVPSVSDIRGGPNLAKPPVIRVATEDTDFKNPVEVQFGHIKEFKLGVPVDYLGWEIPGAYPPRVGDREVQLPDGKWEMRSPLGWSVPLVVQGGAMKLNGEPTGIAIGAVTVTADGLSLGPPKDLNRVRITVPVLLGSYTVQTADGKPLIAAFTGPQTANLPPGKYKLAGGDWAADLNVGKGTAEAKLPEAKLAGIVSWPGGIAVFRTGTSTVQTPWGALPMQVPPLTNKTVSIGLASSTDNTTRLCVTVSPSAPPTQGKNTGRTYWRMIPSFISGGGSDWNLRVRLTPLDPSSVIDPVEKVVLADLHKLPQDGLDIKFPPLPSGVYFLHVSAWPPGAAGDSAPSFVHAKAVVVIEGRFAASLWFAANRTAYRADEPIEICAWQSGVDADKKMEPLELRGGAVGGHQLLTLAHFDRNWDLFRIAPGTLRPGEYYFDLYSKTGPVAWLSLTVVPADPATHFAIDAYGTVLGPAAAEQLKTLNDLGVNTMCDQGGIWQANEARATAMEDGLAAVEQALPGAGVGPSVRYNTQGDHFMDIIDRLNMRFFAQWGTAHQPYGYGITFADPVVVNRLTMTSLWASQVMRQHPGFLGMNVFDEGGTPRGPHFYEDASYLEYDAFAKNFGRPKPRYYGDDNDAGRAWIYDKQLQHNTVYSAIGRRLEDVNKEADPGAHLYLGTQNGNLNSMGVDGGHPPLAYQAITLSTFHWYSDYIQSAFILLGNEYHFMQVKPIEFWPLIWADGHTDLTRHEVNLAVSRQVDGIGYFHWPAMLNAPGQPEEDRAAALKALDARLTRYGDFFRAVRRDRPSEVAVLYSFYDFAPKLIPEKTHVWSAYENAYKAAYTGYLAISSCLRLGIQTGWVGEEEILQRDGLAGRKVLIIPGITAMKPELQKKIAAFAAGGGTVFVDAGTTVEIPGAKKLSVDFAAMVDQAKYDQKTDDGKGNKLNIDRVVLDKILPALKPIEDLAGPHPRPGAIDLLVTKQVNGSAQYFYCLNDHMLPLDQLPAPLTAYKVQKYWQPIATDVTLPVKGVVYDVFAGNQVATADGSVKLPVNLGVSDMAVFAVLPEAIGGVRLKCDKSVRQGESLPITVRVVNRDGKIIDAAVPLEIRVLDAAGKGIRPTIYRSTNGGVFTEELRIGAFDPEQVRVIVTELLSGSEGEAEVRVKPLHADDAVRIEKDPVIIENEKAIGRFMATEKNVIVALGDGEGSPSEEDVAPLIKALRHRGANVEIRRASELCRNTFDSFVGRGVARLSAPPFPGSEAIPDIDKPVIAIGSSDNNRLIWLATQARNWTRYSDRDFPPGAPGTGRGYVAYLWQPFSLTDDAIIVAAEDKEGLRKSIKWLAEAEAGDHP